ncbi:E3 ubiquitin-protein ligase SDIR1-like [Vigna radiata var. radiata]|uniref:E3 ubiquitin-protein ligase SDIR1-like n=1 Tax=Vigna radiata var. radiata TaxID=3916 RepID=A0A3Q0ELD7_VIGRR|nr:E3 ubiquitin-protein ligase SDIR1-like [Vigna radiata var. radiata]
MSAPSSQTNSSGSFRYSMTMFEMNQRLYNIFIMGTGLTTFMPTAIFKLITSVFFQSFPLQLRGPPFALIPSQTLFQEGPDFLRTLLSQLPSPLLPPSSLRLFDTDIIETLINMTADEIRRIFHIDDHVVTSSESQLPEIPMWIVISVTDSSMHLTTQYPLRTVPAVEKPIDTLLKKSTMLQTGRCCCICLDEFDLNAERYTLPCQHFFHQKCITRWLQTSQTCPMCRQSLQTLKD